MKSEQTAQTFSIFGTPSFVTIDTDILHNWSVDQVAKRLIAVGALTLISIGSLPLLTGVHGQSTNPQLQYEVEELQRQVTALPDMKTQLALLAAQVKEEQDTATDHWKRQEEFQSKLIWGLLGTAGSVFMAMFVWVLQHFGVTIGKPDRGRTR